MKVAVEGCCHGELDKIYETITQMERQSNIKIDLLLICGDFQSVRNFDDLQAMAVPPKFQKLNTFYKYYSGEKVAPVLTIFIGGNHEASNFLQELPYGGWVAKNIYYMGYAGIIQVGGVRIGGISGIYKGRDFNKGHYERPPYDENTKRSVYHVRNQDVFRLKQISRHLDIFISHDWPEGIYNYGQVGALIKRKPFFKEEIDNNCLGSKACADLLKHLKPSYWFAAHLHVRFSAHVEHPPTESGELKRTKFLALDKCLPRRMFLQILDIPHREEEGFKIKLDSEWLSILQSTNHLLNLSAYNQFMPGPNGNERYNFMATDQELKETLEQFGGDLTLPENFEQTAPPVRGPVHHKRRDPQKPLTVVVNPQTTLLCTMLNITDPNVLYSGKAAPPLPPLQDYTDSPRSTNHNDDDEQTFIDSSFDVSTENVSNSSFGNFNAGRKDDDELKSILLSQKKLSARIHSASVAGSSPSCVGSPGKEEAALTKRQSISDRLKSLKTDSTPPSNSESQEEASQSESGSESISRLTKSDTVSFTDDDDELQAILARQTTVQKSLSSSCDSKQDTEFKSNESSSSDSKKRSSSEFDESSGFEFKDTPKISPNKKMKRRNVSLYEENQE